MFTYPDDPATRYALRVRHGEEVTSRLVRLATERHLHDLETATARGLAWRANAAQEVCDFFADILRLPDGADTDGNGRPFRLDGWESFIAGSLCGWFTADGHVRFRVAYNEIAKGNGKTAFFAGLMVYKLVKAERGQQHYCAAPTQSQAALAFADAVAMVAASPYLREIIDQHVGNLSVRSTGAFLRPISSEKRGLDGKRVSAALVDELQEHPDEIVSAKLRAGTKGDPNAQVLEITNSGSDLESVCRKHHDHSVEVLTGAVSNDAWFAFICHLDACPACHATGGSWHPQDDCAACDDWQTEGLHWRKANPGLGSALPWQYLREQVREAQAIPSQRNIVRRLNFCQWTQSHAAILIPPLKWAERADPSVSWTAFAGREVVLGIDLSAKIDLSSVVGVSVRAGADVLNTEVDVATAFWMPADTIQQRAQEDRVPYPDWAKTPTRIAPYLHASPGQMVDHDVILEFVLDVSRRCSIRAIGIDQAGATAFVTRLQRELGPDIVSEVPQGFRHLSEPTKWLEALVLSGRLSHDANPVMGYCLANLATEENRWQELRPIKVNQRTRIDGGVALILALGMVLRLQPAPMPEYSMFVIGQ